MTDNKNTEILVQVNRSDLIFLRRLLDTLFGELEAHSKEDLHLSEDEFGDYDPIDTSLLIEVDEALNLVKGYL